MIFSAIVAKLAAKFMHVDRTAVKRAAPIGWLVLVFAASGCAPAQRALTPQQHAARDAAGAILELNPLANWTDCFNRLVATGPAALDWLMDQPPVAAPVAPDDLRAMVHHSLIRLLADPRGAPRLSIQCLDTTGGLLSFEPKVRGRSLGPVHQPAPQAPRRWHDLYPAEFDHRLAGEVNAEDDRRALRDWYRSGPRGGPSRWGATPLTPKFEHVVPMLSRRYADLWSFDPHDAITLCGGAVDPPAMISQTTYDYNVVRSACVWLGTTSRDQQQMQLIELLASSNETVAHNVRFALQFCPDPRIREVLDRYNRAELSPPSRDDGPRDDAKRPWSL